MAFNLQFQICGLILAILVAFMFFSHKSLRLISERIYSRLLLATLACLLLDMAKVISINLTENPYGFLNLLICKGYLFSIVLVMYLLLSYALIDVYNTLEKYNRRKFLFCLPVAILPFVLYVAPIRIHLSEGEVYTSGLATLITYVMSFLYLLISLLYTFIYRHKMQKGRSGSIIFLVANVILAGMLQFTRNDWLLVGFAMALSIAYMYMRLENPDENVDRVSKCFNETAFLYYLKEMEERHKSYSTVTVIFDDFKFVNDTFGTNNANTLIRMVADFLDSLKGVLVFRGADLEFTVVFHKMQDMQNALAKIEKRFKEPWNVKGIDINLSVSICYLVDCSIIDEIGELTEVIHYFSSECRKRGKGTVIPINEEEFLRKKEIDYAENTLRWALEEDKIQVFFQPIYSVTENKYISAEALVRIEDQYGTFLSPELFIPIAEKNGLILELGMIVFEKVCQFMQAEKLSRFQIEYIEINLSVVQCMQDSLAYELLRIMDKYHIPPETINLEITETAAVNSEKTLQQNMDELISRKVSFSLDDYGSGYSNLSYVVGLPLSIVKLDKSLVWSSFENDKAKVAMEFAISMIRSLNMKVLAEGIETIEQYREMERLGIDYIQGFLFSRPLPPQEFLNIIKRPIDVLSE